MANKVLLKKSSTASKIPLTSDLDYGELAINYTDGKLYFKDSSNNIKSFSEDTNTVTLTGTQTLSNKTLTSPTINGGSISSATQITVDNIDINGNTIASTNINGNLVLSGNGTGKVSISNSYTLPNTDSSTGYVLSTNGSGTVSFVDVNTLISGSVNFSIDQNFGTIDVAVTSSSDWGLITDGAGEVYDWGTVVVAGLIYPDQLVIPQYTVSSLPSSALVGQLIYVSDETGGPVLAFSDGTNFRRVTDRAIVS